MNSTWIEPINERGGEIGNFFSAKYNIRFEFGDS